MAPKRKAPGALDPKCGRPEAERLEERRMDEAARIIRQAKLDLLGAYAALRDAQALETVGKSNAALSRARRLVSDAEQALRRVSVEAGDASSSCQRPSRKLVAGRKVLVASVSRRTRQNSQGIKLGSDKRISGKVGRMERRSEGQPWEWPS